MISLQPRYRRLLSVGALLDESIHLFRQHWITFALFSLVALLPSWLLILLTYLGNFRRPLLTSTSSEEPPVGALIILFSVTIVQGLAGLVWSAASTVAATTLLGGEQPTIAGVYGLALRRLVPLILAILAFGFLSLLLFIASTVLFVVTLFGTLGTLIALIGLIYWWVKPEGRRRWLKWLIILTAPWGLMAYYSVRWSLFLPAIVLENEGPIGGLRRSSQLVEHEWFRAGAVLTLTSLIVSVLFILPLLLVGMVVGLLGLNGLLDNSDPTGSVFTQTATVVLQALFSSIATIAYLLLFVDLRNRREGSDIAERISSLEAITA